MYRIGDHIFGLLPLLASRLNGSGGVTGGAEDPRLQIQSSEETQVDQRNLFGCIIPCLSFYIARRDLRSIGNTSIRP